MIPKSFNEGGLPPAMPSIDPVSQRTKKKLNYLKAALTDEFDGEPTWDETINWLMENEETASSIIQKELQTMRDPL